VLSTVDMVVQRRDGTRWLRELDDGDDEVRSFPRRRCDMLCTCSFVNDVTFARQRRRK